MLIFETILILLLLAIILSEIAKRLQVPYPTLLAIGGTCLALLPIPGLPQLDFSPELILTLFVAPILLNSAHDTSLRDIKENWRSVLSLVLIAVGLTTFAVAYTAHYLIPDLSWAAAITLGALLAPPDAVAAMAVLSRLKMPYRIRTILEGESLLNDASALLIYKLAVGAVMVGSFSFSHLLPTFSLVVFGGLIAGWILGKIFGLVIKHITDVPTAIIFQFIAGFGVWLLAEYLKLSGIVTVVVFGFVMTQYSMIAMSARLRVSTFAIWESVTFVLNVLAFTLIGLQMRGITETFKNVEKAHWIYLSLIILAVVIVIRLLWVMFYTIMRKYYSSNKVSIKSGIIVGWSGMRGIVTLAAAMALPAEFPYRDFIQLTAFVVVIGTLLIHGLTFKPLITLLNLPRDNKIDKEITKARSAALKAALSILKENKNAAAKRISEEYKVALAHVNRAQDPHKADSDTLRREGAKAARNAIIDLHTKGEIGDDAYRRVEEEWDWLELSATPQSDNINKIN